MMRFLRLLVLVILLIGISTVFGQENPDGFPDPDTVTIAGTIQSQLGCGENWQPPCGNTMLTYDPEQDLWLGSFDLEVGNYEYKVALNGGWDENYGLNAEAGGPNIPLEVAEAMTVTFTYDHKTGVVSDSVGTADMPTVPEDTNVEAVIPDLVNIPGTIQPEIGCPGPWQPDCLDTALDYDETGDVFLRTFDMPAGGYEYKVAINGSWAENYGAFADQDGPNIILNVPEDQFITFIYDHKTNWISDDVRHLIVTAPGDFQDELGCSGDWQPECMRSWLQDVDGDGIYSFTTSDIPAGDYEVKVSINRSWDENYGANGEPDGANIPFSVPEDGTPVTFIFDPSVSALVVSAGGAGVSESNLREARAYWVSADTIAWDVSADAESYQLFYSPDASFRVGLFGINPDSQYETLDLSVNPEGLSEETLVKFPHLAGLTALQIAEDNLESVPELLKGQVAVGMLNDSGDFLNLTSLQIPGVLDDLFTYDGELGVIIDDEIPTLRVWSPTAQSVNLHLFDEAGSDAEATIFEMTPNPDHGTWEITGEADWLGKFYLYEVQVYAPSTMAIETNLVTDPYSVSLSLNSLKSQIIDITSTAWMPDGWQDLMKPTLNSPNDVIVYELHIRDFSVFDESVPEEVRGTYLAFTLDNSNGMQHLTALQQAGLTHLHLLPTFDITTINENKRRWFEPSYEELAEFPADSAQQQALIDPIRDLDAFNWGYDPFHYNVPEGSYSTDPNGAQRILEYRQMVQSLNQVGLRFVMDVVYNHTNASGQAGKSVLDRVVPGYYHRLNAVGRVETSTCCQNTATEHDMMRKLMIDSILHWAIEYKVDGFRFDLMGHHMREDMLAVREALDSLTIEEHGVDGTTIYVYGEGWNFGEVADNARGINATQLNMGGTGIGTFNDRLRDAVRGGNPFGGQLEQGLANGVFTNPNGLDDLNESLERALLFADQTRIGLAGNLRDYSFENMDGDVVSGAEIDYNGSPAGYNLLPQENIVYVSKHDNETLYDEIAYKAPLATPVPDRVRMQNLGLSYVMYSQGIPFFHAGSDMLRSKSMDRNSYNSGDWFNRLDFAYQTNNFGIGLPPAADNQGVWDLMVPRLSDDSLIPTQEDILANVMAFREMLQVRQSSTLFRLPTAEDVQNRLAFHNTGTDQLPGVIVMSLADGGDLEDIDPNHDLIIVVFNGRNEAIDFSPQALQGTDLALELHPVLANSSDEIMQTASYDNASATFSVPALTTAVFVLPQG